MPKVAPLVGEEALILPLTSFSGQRAVLAIELVSQPAFLQQVELEGVQLPFGMEEDCWELPLMWGI